jgi:hypothetical protein
MPVALGAGEAPDTGGVAAETADQLVPFHWLPKTVGVETLNPVPSVKQRFAARQDTELRDTPEVRPAGIAGVVALQVLPFHISASAPAPVEPTAMQKDGPAHDTPLSSLLALGGSVTPVTTLHVLPFHCSMRGLPPAPAPCRPTATQNDAVAHVTALS